ncbi:uncharacterized protein LOC110828823 isoform X2 [Zootermopsis nevadensis]|uniref:uncharacterized protein LOC110828823 isoform X2 n=1 Tax=Zootermopsis nevadensis TaxID=136037 RepID=UPI000B8E69BD|nr:uncharacterized protein LOC110828823 isoform X2 [Zootermopsis nevadensis]
MNYLRKCGLKNALCLQFDRHLYNVFSPRIQLSRLYRSGSKNSEIGKEENEGSSNFSEKTPSTMSSKYNIFRDEDAEVILDVEEERLKQRELPQEQSKDDFFGLNLNRGVHGVFDIEEIVDILRREKLGNIFVASLPPEAKYVDYIVVVTGKSKRHMSAVAEFVRKLYKKKRHPHDLIPRIEGENSKDWMALDLGRQYCTAYLFKKCKISV